MHTLLLCISVYGSALTTLLKSQLIDYLVKPEFQ